MTNELDTFGKFMTEVINLADSISFEKSGRPLADKYEAPAAILKMIGAVTSSGWASFKALAALVSKTSYFAFAAALTLFVISPLGIIAVGALIYWGGEEALKLLYNNSELVKAIKIIGDRYEGRFNACDTDVQRKILLNQAAEDLYNFLASDSSR